MGINFVAAASLATPAGSACKNNHKFFLNSGRSQEIRFRSFFQMLLRKADSEEFSKRNAYKLRLLEWSSLRMATLSPITRGRWAPLNKVRYLLRKLIKRYVAKSSEQILLLTWHYENRSNRSSFCEVWRVTLIIHKLGSWVLAVVNPFDLNSTVTQEISVFLLRLEILYF